MNWHNRIICKLLDHKWGYKEYLEINNSNNAHVKKRRCKRCGNREIINNEGKWEKQNDTKQ